MVPKGVTAMTLVSPLVKTPLNRCSLDVYIDVFFALRPICVILVCCNKQISIGLLGTRSTNQKMRFRRVFSWIKVAIFQKQLLSNSQIFILDRLLQCNNPISLRCRRVCIEVNRKTLRGSGASLRRCLFGNHRSLGFKCLVWNLRTTDPWFSESSSIFFDLLRPFLYLVTCWSIVLNKIGRRSRVYYRESLAFQPSDWNTNWVSPHCHKLDHQHTDLTMD